jgi:hypothetical protein
MSEGWYQWEGERFKERVLQGECGRNIMYPYMEMKK